MIEKIDEYMKSIKYAWIIYIFIYCNLANAGEIWQKPFKADEHTIALYHFDEVSGSGAADSSRNRNKGRLWGLERQPVPLWVEGKFGEALEFDGHFGWLDIPERAYYVGMNNLTVEAWVFIYDPEESSSSNSLGEIISTPGYSLRMTKDSTRLEFTVYTDGPVDKNRGMVISKPIEFEEWHHIAGTYDGKYCHLFIDGKLADEKQVAAEGNVKAVMKGRKPDGQHDSPSTLRVYSPVSIGGGVNPINAVIDEVRISDCVRYKLKKK